MARSFNGTSDVIALTAGGQAYTGTESFAAWIKFASVNVTGDILCGNSSPSLGYVFRWHGASGTTGAIELLHTFTLLIGASNTQTVTTGVWYHAGVSYDGTNFIFYWNGVNAGSGSQAAIVVSAQYFIGSSGSSSEWWNGSLADIASWNIVLSAGEFAALAQGARPGKIRRANLNGWWPLDGLQSPEPDYSGNIFNGTLTGTALAAGPPVMQFTPRWPQSLAVAASPIVFRKTLSQIGGRVGTRQAQGWAS